MALTGETAKPVPSSREEDDLLARSSKKIKNGNKNVAGHILQGHWPKLDDPVSHYAVGGPSFVEKLKGINKQQDGLEDGISDDTMSQDFQSKDNEEEPLCETVEDPNRNFPTFCFSGKMKKCLYKVWHKALIMKLLDRNIGYKALLNRLQTLWAKKGVVNLINIGCWYFVVKLTNRDDYFNALTGGPWMIYDHYLTVRPWEPKFRPHKATIDKVAVWVRMPELSLEYYDEEALTIIGNRIGETIRVDMNMSCQLRGHYARVCVLVNLEQQLMSGFSLDGEDYYLEYEGLHMLCSNCGVFC